MSCCPDGSLPGLVEDSARTLSGVVTEKMYLVEPPSPSEVGVVVIYDIFGFSGGRIKSVCDGLALGGFHVAMPDVYDGGDLKSKGMFENPEAVAWLKGLTVWETQKELLEPAFAALEKKGVKKIAAVGFCWGAYGVCKLASEGKIGAGASFHPSLKIGNMFFGESEEDQVKVTKAPLAFYPAGNDPDMYKDGTLANLVNAAGFDCETVEFPNQQHGFVARGDTSDPELANDVKKALELCTAFLTKHLA